MIVVIVGPTCTKKSLTAIFLANKINAEIINGDAFQCYKELNIGVAKPTINELKMAPHHLFSFVDVNKPFSIADYQTFLRDKIDEIKKRNKNIIIVGGSGLYIRSALYDYEFKEMKVSDSSKYDNFSNDELHEMLNKIDPLEATKLHKNNRKRVIRALEIFTNSNINKSTLLANQEHKLIYKDAYIVSPLFDREKLYENINSRVDKMFELGLETEVRNLYFKYGNIQSLQAIGYKEFVPYFKDEVSLEEVKELIKKNSRNYAKRQITFVKHQFENVYYYKDDNDLLNYVLGLEKNDA